MSTRKLNFLDRGDTRKMKISEKQFLLWPFEHK